MNQLILSHTSAVCSLRDERAGSRNTINYVNNCILGNQYPVRKIDILVTDKSKVYKDKVFQRHFSNNRLISKSLIPISKTFFVTSPELTILQLASKLDYFELALLVFEFCGTFSIINRANTGFINNVKPITSVEKIQDFVKEYSKNFAPIKGLKNLIEILSFASNYSNSPMESRLFIKLCGPRNKGLYGCKGLRLNSSVRISESACKIAGQNLIIPDISNKRNKIAIEYDSSQFHEESLQGQKDKRRRDALVKDGWSVITIVPAQINNPEIFDIIAKQILRNLKQGSRIRIKNFEAKRNEAFAFLR